MFFKVPVSREKGDLFMLQDRFSTVRNITAALSFGKPAMIICDAEKYALSAAGTNHDTRHGIFLPGSLCVFPYHLIL